LAAQPADDLLRRKVPVEIFLHDAAQLRVDRELGWLGSAGALVRERVGGRRAITTPVGVSRKLATDRRWAASQPPSDRAHRLTLGVPQRDLLALCECQTAYEISGQGRIVIIEFVAARVGLIVETVEEALTVAEDRLSSLPVGRGWQRIDEHAALQTGSCRHYTLSRSDRCRRNTPRQSHPHAMPDRSRPS
jgi:hypothetical protein